MAEIGVGFDYGRGLGWGLGCYQVRKSEKVFVGCVSKVMVDCLQYTTWKKKHHKRACVLRLTTCALCSMLCSLCSVLCALCSVLSCPTA